MLYYLPWILLILITIGLWLGAFLWSMKAGQFSDQTRARYLPLVDGLSPFESESHSGSRLEFYTLMIILGIGVFAMFAAVYLVLTR